MIANSAQTASRGLHLENDSFTPYYQQIVDQIRVLVRSGVLREGDVFHSEGEVAAILGISKMPVRQAFMKLRAEGLLVIERGKKPVVGSEVVSWDFQQLHGFNEEMKLRGLESSNKILNLSQVPADSEVAKALRLKQTATVYQLERLYFVSGEPVAIVTSYLPVALFPNLQDQDLDNVSLYHVFENVYKRRLKWAEEEIGAVTATKKNAAVLKTVPGAALLFVKEKTYDTQRVPIEFSQSLLRADRYKVTVMSVRKSQDRRTAG